MAVQNASEITLRGVTVTVRSAPEWVTFKTNPVVMDSIPSQSWREAVFEFRVAESTADQPAAVVLAITDAHGRLLGSRVLKFRTVVLPKKTALAYPYPNPANPGSTIQYTLHASSHVKIEIYNTLGQRVRNLVDEDKPAGMLSALWDGKNDQGLAVASGMYIVKLTATEKGQQQAKQFTSKLIIQK